MGPSHGTGANVLSDTAYNRPYSSDPVPLNEQDLELRLSNALR